MQDGSLDDFHRLVYRALQFAARGVQVPTAIEELLCHLITGEVVDRA